ncbi:hypothetical protein H6H01_23185 [Nostoc calcicola FACHB-3891]|nr:hypothetical protein [Nostoc calcicola FACHB-3891]MDZ8063607.1 hypothetical protein [Nostoc sp. EkiNYC01]
MQNSEFSNLDATLVTLDDSLAAGAIAFGVSLWEKTRLPPTLSASSTEFILLADS